MATRLVYSLIALVLINSVAAPILNTYPEYLVEHGIIENIQVVVLFSCSIVFMVAAVLYRRMRLISIVASLICLGFIVRETGFDRTLLKGPAGHLIRLLAYIIVAVLIVASVLFRRSLLNPRQRLSNDIHAILRDIRDLRYLVPLALLGMVVSWIFDKNVFHVTNNVTYEELAETCGYTMMLASAIFYLFYLKGRASDDLALP